MSFLGKRRRNTQSNQQKAYWANRRFNSLHPWSTAGAARIPRGSDWSLSSFGHSYKTATPDQKNWRKMTGFTGRGKYGVRKTLGKFAKKNHIGKHMYDAGVAGAVAGATLGPEAVVPAMAAGYTGSGLYGRGAYTYTSRNSLISGGKPSMSVQSGYNDNQELVITHCEYIQDVFAPSDSNFHNETMSVNPGLMESLPWLSQIAANYEEYEFIQLLFHFKSTVDAGNTANGATGTIILATNYNSDQPSFTAKEPMIQYHGAVSGRLTDGIDHGVECDPRKNAGTAIRYVRTNAPGKNESKKDFDLGRFQFAVTNAPSGFYNQQIGELWATYKIKLGKPRLYSSLYKNLPYDRWIDTYKETNDNWGLYAGDCWSLGSSTSTKGPSYTGYNEQNTLGVTLLANTQSVANTTYGIAILFPDYITGSFKVQLRAASKLSLFNSGTPNSVLSGNVVAIPKGGPDMTGITEDSHCITSAYDFCANASEMQYTLFVSVSPATAGIDNKMQIYITGCQDVAGVCASQLVIEPFNKSLSDRFLMPDGTYKDLSEVGAHYSSG